MAYIKGQKHKARDDEIKALWERGFSCAEISRRYSLSRERVRQICGGHRRKYKPENEEFIGLSTGLSNALKRAGICTKMDLIKQLDEGVRMYRISHVRLDELSNYLGRYVVGIKQDDGTKLVRYWRPWE